MKWSAFYRIGNVIVKKITYIQLYLKWRKHTNTRCTFKIRRRFYKKERSRIKFYTSPFTGYILANGPRVHKRREGLLIWHCWENDGMRTNSSDTLLVSLQIVQNFLSSCQIHSISNRKNREGEGGRERDIKIKAIVKQIRRINKNDHLISIERIVTFLYREQCITMRCFTNVSNFIFTSTLNFYCLIAAYRCANTSKLSCGFVWYVAEDVLSKI